MCVFRTYKWSIRLEHLHVRVRVRVSLYPIQKPLDTYIRRVCDSDSSHPIIILTAGIIQSLFCQQSTCFAVSQKKQKPQNLFGSPFEQKLLNLAQKMHIQNLLEDCAKCLSKIHVNNGDWSCHSVHPHVRFYVCNMLISRKIHTRNNNSVLIPNSINSIIYYDKCQKEWICSPRDNIFQWIC